MLLEFDSRIRQVGTFLKVNPRKFHIIFKESSECFFLNPGIALNWTDALDMQELDIILQILKISGNGWQDELIGKKAHLIVDCKEAEDGTLSAAIKAIGRPKKKHKKTKDKRMNEADDTLKTSGNSDNEDSLNDLFLILSSGVQLVSKERAMEIITSEISKEEKN